MKPHTPGPWKITSCGKCKPGEESWGRCANISDPSGVRVPTTLANLRLKAAAPELLSILQDMMLYLQALSTESEYLQCLMDAEDVIAKIKGEL